jgi:hypothetical protein
MTSIYERLQALQINLLCGDRDIVEVSAIQPLGQDLRRKIAYE